MEAPLLGVHPGPVSRDSTFLILFGTNATMAARPQLVSHLDALHNERWGGMTANDGVIPRTDSVFESPDGEKNIFFGGGQMFFFGFFIWRS